MNLSTHHMPTQDKDDIIIEARDLSLTFSGDDKRESYKVLEDINLSIKKSEFVSLVGPSGSGKSTMLNLLAGYIRPSEGTVLLHDQEITGPLSKVGVVFQKANLYPWLSCAENIGFGPKMKKLDKKEIDKISERYLKLVSLEDFKDFYPSELSGGMQQRVSIARSLANSPEVLLLDEPMGALDALTRSEIQSMIRNIWIKTGMTFFMITHDIDEAMMMSNRILVLGGRPGKIISEYTTDFYKDIDENLEDIVYSDEYIKMKDNILKEINQKGATAY